MTTPEYNDELGKIYLQCHFLLLWFFSWPEITIKKGDNVTWLP